MLNSEWSRVLATGAAGAVLGYAIADSWLGVAFTGAAYLLGFASGFVSLELHTRRTLDSLDFDPKRRRQPTEDE